MRATRPFISAAADLLTRYEPRCVGFTFMPTLPFGMVAGAFDEPLLNLGAAGAMFIMGIAEAFTEKDVGAVFHQSCDRDEFHRWLVSLKHTLDQTLPKLNECRALKRIDESANADLYRAMGLRC